MRQVEALLFATLVQQPKSKKLTDHCRAGTMLRAARALGAVDLESRCTLLLQANGTLREVMKVRETLTRSAALPLETFSTALQVSFALCSSDSITGVHE